MRILINGKFIILYVHKQNIPGRGSGCKPDNLVTPLATFFGGDCFIYRKDGALYPGTIFPAKG